MSGDSGPAGTLGTAGRVSRRTLLTRVAYALGGLTLATGLLDACASSATPSPAPAAATQAPAAAPAQAPAAAATTAAAQTAGTPKRGGTLILAKPEEIVNLDPHLDNGQGQYNLSPLWYNRLFEWDCDGKLVPTLAERYELSPDNKVWTFYLRKGAKFHPPLGREFEAADAKYSLERILDPKTGSGGRGYLVAISDITVLDKYTLKIATQEPSSSLLAGLAAPYCAIVPKEIVEQKGDLKQTVVGTGAFILEEWVPASYLKLKRNPDYWESGKPYLDNVRCQVIQEESSIVAQLRGGNVHLGVLFDAKNYNLLKDDPKLVTKRLTPVGFDMMCINNGRKPFDDRRVRLALSYAIDRNEILQAAAAGMGKVTGPFTEAMAPFTLPLDTWKEYYTPNLDKAKQLLAEAGQPNGFKTTIMASQSGRGSAEATVIAAQLKKIGVDAQVDVVDTAMWMQRFAKPAYNYDLAMNFASGEFDPDALLYRRFSTTERAWNNDGDAEIDELLRQGKLAMDQAKRKEVYDKAQRALIDKAVQIWICSVDQVNSMQTSVKGYKMHPAGFYRGLREAWLE